MSFNFGISEESAVRTSKRQFKPWGIYDVEFKGCEVREFKGKKDPSKTYKVLTINFENDECYFSHSLFFPQEGDDERRENVKQDGSKTVFPSNFEVLMATVEQTGQILNPKGFEKMKAASSKFRSFDDVANALIKITTPVIGAKTKLKLVGRTRDGKVVPAIPNIVGINHDGEKFISDNYIGDNLYFSDYEDGKRKEYLKAAPTKVEEKVKDLDMAPNNEADELNLDDLAEL